MVYAAPAHALWTLSVSAGTGWQAHPSASRISTNLSVAPGISLLPKDLLRFELGFIADMPDLRNRHADLQIRPMLLINPPLFPMYARLVAGVSNIAHGPAAVRFGAAAGVRLSLAHVGLFAEAGYIPYVRDNTFFSVLEGRIGTEVLF